MSDWWLTINQAGTVACWHLGDVDDDQREQLITRARTALDVPVDDMGVHLHLGRPHDKFMARCSVRDRAELVAVDSAAITAYRGRVATEARRVRRAAARAALADLDPDARAEVIAEFSRTSGGTTASGR